MLYDLLLIFYFVGTLVGLCLVFKKAGYAAWKALIPIYNIVLWVRLCGKTQRKAWQWYVYFLVPVLNVFTFLLMVVETAKAFHRYGFWEQTFAVIFPWIYLPMAGLNKWEYHDLSQEPEHKVSEVRDWIDSIVFALVAAMIIRGNFIEFYRIPSSSMEKSLMIGDYLMVSKIAYGPRTAMTPLSFPLVHNVMPLSGGNMESYLKWIKMPYHRYPGLRSVERGDAVVFNYPDGDTVCTAFQSNASYHDLIREYGRDVVWNNPQQFGKIISRPVDKKENFIKRCIGLPGEDLQIVDQQVLINGKAIENPDDMQFTYRVLFKSGVNPRKILDEIGLNSEDYQNAIREQQYTGTPFYVVPLTKQMADGLSYRQDVDLVEKVVHEAGLDGLMLYPHAEGYDWSVDNYGPIHIPAKGETIQLSLDNLPLYKRVIVNFEENSLEVVDGKIMINGKETSEYTFKMDYYWMMGDNRHNSADSRYWGFVPENHIVGRASMVMLSRDKDHGGYRKGRWLMSVKK